MRFERTHYFADLENLAKVEGGLLVRFDVKFEFAKTLGGKQDNEHVETSGCYDSKTLGQYAELCDVDGQIQLIHRQTTEKSK